MKENFLATPELIPARMLNEYVYCPRLFYLEYVQREWAENMHVLEGRYVHRRVEQAGGPVPSSATVTPEVSIQARSVEVGCPELGAVAVIDVLESDDGQVVPVDYKRGTAPNVPEGAWEPDRIQVCLQGLLLRANGYRSSYGIIYYAADKTRVRVDFTSILVECTKQLLAGARALATSETAPPPLVNSNKCPRCSLVGICLPDEINFLRSENKASEAISPLPPASEGAIAEDPPSVLKGKKEVRRLVPARDDNKAVYVQSQGHSIGLNGTVLEIRDKGQTVDSARLVEISQVNLFGNVQISAQALRALVNREVPILHLSYGGWLQAITGAPPHKNIELRRRQFQAADDPTYCLKLAKAFVGGKIRNSRLLLRRNGRGLSSEVLSQLAALRKAVDKCSDLSSLLGIEGNAAREYFRYFSTMFKPDDQPPFDFTGRNRRPPKDPVNALLSFAYGLLVKEIVVAVIGVGFDPYLGFYHQPRYGRPALALDLMEEFRPLVTDSVVITVINNGEIGPSDFIQRGEAVALVSRGRKTFIEAFERRLDHLVTHPVFGYQVSYRRVFEIQARLLARTLMGEIPNYIPFVTR
ncbi:MAG: CRISPR-associated endonuclease Cas4g/Cas1g [Acidobacteriota bacterium]